MRITQEPDLGYLERTRVSEGFALLANRASVSASRVLLRDFKPLPQICALSSNRSLHFARAHFISHDR